MPPIYLDSSLATLPGSRREEAQDVSEYGRAGFAKSRGRRAGVVEAVKRTDKAEVVLRLRRAEDIGVPVPVVWTSVRLKSGPPSG